MQVHVLGTHADNPDDTAKAFAKLFYTTNSHIAPPLSPISVFCSDFLPLVPSIDTDIKKSINRLRSTKPVGLDDTPGCIINGYSTISVPVLKYVFNLSVSQKHFPTQWKQSTIVFVSK
jgi:hypothetical protein